ncbi:hypothetical protein XM38_012400 [Halomicronema hongdechloris C2206]|uniref:Uncharacterized protein n=1 Tax=Halomicronema hongdechloris C2206 TaxID=1641165 RepID=A0A1Z3HJ37_9CYAN|nr:hypothetical protein [Halomicronema hongdechloris]ASC70303.1 hypothetical protein XM38_012400 [Halomicronema hongdechloris C2206]
MLTAHDIREFAARIQGNSPELSRDAALVQAVDMLANLETALAAYGRANPLCPQCSGHYLKRLSCGRCGGSGHVSAVEG